MLNLRFLLAFLTSIFAYAAMAAEELTPSEIQGTGLQSDLLRQMVRTGGVITYTDRDWFYMSDPAGDGNDETSDAIQVQRRSHGFEIGDQVVVEGQVDEATVNGENGQTITSLRNAVVSVQSQGNSVDPVVIGSAGRLPPTETVFPSFQSGDINASGLAFYESLEGMLLRLEAPTVVGPTNRFGEFYVVVEGGQHATGMNSLGGVSLSPGDTNPELLQVQVPRSLSGDAKYQVGIGDSFSFLQGVLSYDRGLYELILIESGDLTENPAPAPTIELSDIGASQLTIGSYNVENLDPIKESLALVSNRNNIDDDVADGKFAGIATQIVEGLGAPDIIALQEVQDNDGAEFSDQAAADQTLSVLTTAISDAGGPTYEAVMLSPADDTAGGQPGGNIQVAFLYNPDRVSFNNASLKTISAPAFEQSRLPLQATFDFNGTVVNVINVHFSSKGGSDALYGTIQPPRDRSLQQRTAQARAVREAVRGLTSSGDHSTIVLGDFNSFWFETPVLLLSGGTPEGRNLALDKPPLERVSYTFQGNSQALDHVIAYLGTDHSAELRVLHANSIQPESEQISDHDPKLVIVSFE